MNAINELQGMNLQDVYTKLQLSDDEFDEWLVAMRLLHGSQTCDNCGHQMKHLKNDVCTYIQLNDLE
uniref:Uncharacterized protein n=1 Tax=Acrobeloides nanus TaxID=290746 RepID=A0A914E4J2_9BILA